MTPDIERLKELATKATQGPWRADDRGGMVLAGGKGGSGQGVASADANNVPWIAAANPAAVLSLIAALEAAQGDLQSLRGMYAEACAKALAKDAEIERLTKLLAGEFEVLDDPADCANLHPANKPSAMLRAVRKARKFPVNTCGASRHAQMIAEALLKGQKYHQIDEEPEHVGASLLSTVTSLYEQRTAREAAEAALKEAREGLRPFADLDGEGNDDFPDDAKVTATFGHITDYTLKLGDLRKARALLSKQDSGERP